MEKGLSYFDLAENDYQFLLKDKKEGRVGNMMTVYGRAKGKPLSHKLSVQIFFSVFQKHPCGQNYCHQFGGRICKPDSGNAQKGRKSQKADDHKNKGSGKGKYCGYHSIIQSSKHSAGKNIKSNK